MSTPEQPGRGAAHPAEGHSSRAAEIRSAGGDLDLSGVELSDRN